MDTFIQGHIQLKNKNMQNVEINAFLLNFFINIYINSEHLFTTN